eukprot:TRINITY_DN50889_c0_g1_i2.p1 TRINITY_DN50889_c0_g1~~TRINITY_DN50889_c0_g1_i2.p1  ORF type:complete len:197 (+),score=11.49 TRINITY_DN50889_c0_g1_i2:79-669(+)
MFGVFFFQQNGDHRDLHKEYRRQRQMCIRDRNEQSLPAAILQKSGSVVFNFGAPTHSNDGIPVSFSRKYTGSAGYGFDLWTAPQKQTTTVNNSLATTACCSSQPFYFSTDLPEGNYEVTVWLGNPDQDAETTVKAESRRLMLENIQTKAGEVVEHTFMVNVRTPWIAGTDSIRRKSREYGYLNWDNKLTLDPCTLR